jgi:hypothetical protein
MSDDVVKRTQETAKKLFGAGVKMDPPYLMWREFDKDLANDARCAAGHGGIEAACECGAQCGL